MNQDQQLAIKGIIVAVDGLVAGLALIRQKLASILPQPKITKSHIKLLDPREEWRNGKNGRRGG